MQRRMLTAALRVSLILLFILQIPTFASAGPITYELEWTLDFADEEVSFNPYTGDFDCLGCLGAPATMRYTFDPRDKRFEGFVVDWFGLEFDYGAVMNDLMSPDDRAIVAASLLTPETNGWRGETHSHDSPQFFIRLDPSGLSPFLMDLGPPDEVNLFGAVSNADGTSDLWRHLPIHFISPECGFDGPAGCSAGGGYRVTAVPEPGTLAVISLGSATLLLIRHRRNRQKNL